MRIPEVRAPGTIDEALALKAEHGRTLQPLAGGTDLVPAIRRGICTAGALLDLSRLDDLRTIREDESEIFIGAMATHAAVAESEAVRTHLPVLAAACGSMGCAQIRNLGTIGGNLCNASPAADSIPPLIVLGATCEVRNVRGSRNLSLCEYCTGPGLTCLSADELLIGIRIEKPAARPDPAPRSRGFYLKLGQRRAMAIAKVSVAFLAREEDGVLSDVRIALGAVAPTVCGAPETVAVLEGRTLDRRTIEKAAETVRTECRPIADVRSTIEYRREMVGTLLAQGLRSLLE